MPRGKREFDTKGGTRPGHPLWLTGVNPVKEALRSRPSLVEEVVVARSDPRGRELLELAARQGIAALQKSPQALSALVGYSRHQGAAVRIADFPYTSLDSMLNLPLEARDPLLILDCVQDPQNLGALMRSACFFGMKSVVVPKDRSAKVTNTVARVASGAVSHLPVVSVTNIAATLEALKKSGMWIVGLDTHGGRSLWETDLTLPLGLVVGNEEKGMRSLVRERCDILAQIPGSGLLDSLNAAAAGAVAMAEIRRQRSRSAHSARPE